MDENKQLVPTVKNLLSAPAYKRRFDDILGKKSAGFMASIINLTMSDTNLSNCDPNSVIASAVIAATLDLPIDKNLGFAYIIPYKDKAQFQMGYKGFIQLAQRSSQYKTINATKVFKGDIKSINRFTGDIEFDYENKNKSEVVGYIGYFRLINGFEKYLYMDIIEMEQHAKRYSKTYSSNKDYTVKQSKWTTDFDSMATKTVIKLLISKYGVLSIDMQKALETDQGIINESIIEEGAEINSNTVDYVDNPLEDVEYDVNDPSAQSLEEEFQRKRELNKAENERLDKLAKDSE